MAELQREGKTKKKRDNLHPLLTFQVATLPGMCYAQVGSPEFLSGLPIRGQCPQGLGLSSTAFLSTAFPGVSEVEHQDSSQYHPTGDASIASSGLTHYTTVKAPSNVFINQQKLMNYNHHQVPHKWKLPSYKNRMYFLYQALTYLEKKKTILNPDYIYNRPSPTPGSKLFCSLPFGWFRSDPGAQGSSPRWSPPTSLLLDAISHHVVTTCTWT